MQSVLTIKSKPKSERPAEYLHAIEELKSSFVKSIEIVNKLKDLGLKYGLSPMEVRKDIETSLQGIVGKRQLRNLLPLELKDTTKIHSKKAAAAIAAKSLTLVDMKINRYSRNRKCIIISDKIDTKKFEGLPLKVCITVDG